MSENMLDFQCPHCNAAHHLPAQFAGNRQPCSTCGKPMRLPSAIGSKATPTDQAGHTTQAGAIMVTCPLCSNTLYASADKAGQEILCETCLESVPVPQATRNSKTPKAASPSDAVRKSNDLNADLHLAQSKEAIPVPPPPTTAVESDDSQSSEFSLEPLETNQPLPTQNAPAIPANAPPPTVSQPSSTPNQSASAEPTANSSPAAEEEIIELEAVGQAPSIPVQPLTPIGTPANPGDQHTPPAAEYELAVRWITPCPSCQAHLVVYQFDMEQTVQCENCSQPVTVETRQPLPRPERILKLTHQSIGGQTRLALLAEQQPKQKKEITYQSVVEWQVACDVCGTGISATPGDVGKQLKCPDCFKLLTITAPAKMPAPVKRAIRDELEDDEDLLSPAAASTKQVLSQTPDMRKQIERDEHIASRQILERAKQEQEKQNEEAVAIQLEQDSWIKAIIQLATLPTVVARIVILSVGYGITAGIGHAGTHQSSDGSIISIMGSLGLLVVFAVAFLAVSAFAFSTLLNIVRQTAMGDVRIHEWPAFNLWDWLGEMGMIGLTIAYASIPAGILFWVTDFFLSGLLGIVPVILCAITLTTLFPYFLLGIMDSGSIWQPISRNLNQRLRHRMDLLVKFILFGIPAVFIAIVGSVMLLNKAKFQVILAAIMIWISLVVLCRIVGLLALAIANTDTET